MRIGYDSILQVCSSHCASGVHRYHANKEQSGDLTLSAELSTATNATTTRKESKLMDSEEDEDVTTESKLNGGVDDSDDESDDGKMDRRSPVPENENEKRFNVTLKVDDEKIDDVVPPLPEPSKSEDPIIKTTTVLEEMQDHSSSNNEQGKKLRRSLSSEHFSSNMKKSRERTEESVEAVQKMKEKLQEMGLVRNVRALVFECCSFD